MDTVKNYRCDAIAHGAWMCTSDNYDGAPDAGRQTVGHGATREEAIAAYLEDVHDQVCEAQARNRAVYAIVRDLAAAGTFALARSMQETAARDSRDSRVMMGVEA